MSRVGQRGDSALLELIARSIARVRTTTLGVVTRFDAESERVDVQPIVRRPFVSSKRKSEAAEREPIVPNCIIAWPGSTEWDITGPCPKGSIVLLLICERSIDEFRAHGNTDFEPQSKRRFALTDAIAIPIRYARDSDAGARPLSLRYGESKIDVYSNRIVLDSDTVRLGGDDATDPVVRKSDLDAVLTAIEVWANAHTHPGVTVGSGTSGVVLDQMDIDTTASSVTKSK